MENNKRPFPLSVRSLVAGYRVILAVDFFSKFSEEDLEFEPGAYLVCRLQKTTALRFLPGTRNTYETYGFKDSQSHVFGSIRFSGEEQLPFLQQVLHNWYATYAPVAMSTTYVDVLRRYRVPVPTNLKVLMLNAR